MASGVNESKSPSLRNDLSCDYWEEKDSGGFGFFPQQDKEALYSGNLLHLHQVSISI